MERFSAYLRENLELLSSLDEYHMESFAAFIDDYKDSGATLWVAGNGGSAATASHVVADLCKTISKEASNRVRAVALSEMVGLQTAFANDESFEVAFSRTMQLVGKEGDCVLIISVSGTSPNLINLQRQCRAMGIATVALVGGKGQELAEACDFSVVLKSEDYQAVENAHIFLLHWLVKRLERL